MNIGEKIRELRTAKLMTQSELAGTQITRNMLSCIENGTANPSLQTILYIASRLNVPAGFLLAEEGDEIVYRKMNSFANIKRAYIAGDYRGCRSLCLSGCPEPDDEIRLLLAECDAAIAVEEFGRGKLRSSCRFFDEALEYAEKTIYPTEAIKARAAVYFRYMGRISATLYSDMLDADPTLGLRCTMPIADYVDAMEALDEGKGEKAIAILTRMACGEAETFFVRHLEIRLQMLAGEFGTAKDALKALLGQAEPLCEVALYEVLCDLEICCREINDYKGAYTYATEKVALLEQLLREI
jgi:transcriptional regulator with XRE-family HTH domain